MNTIIRTFSVSVFIWIVALVAVFLWGGVEALILAVLLTILEVTLSFDNAVVNAKILQKMDAKWQGYFITWGILVAVFGTRFVLPILIVAAGVSMSPIDVSLLVFEDPEQYGHLLEGARTAISSFGGIFLLMVSLKYFFDEAKEVHWIHAIERHVAKWGRIEALEIAIALLVLLTVAFLLPAVASTILFSGVLGIILFIVIQGIANAFTVEAGVANNVAKGSAALFVYLEILDAAFSLDGVIGAFAITSDLPIIVAGLGVGAYFVRSLTIYMVRQKTLDTLVYLEHGAHWAILGLSGAMLASIFVHVPEIITGLVGIAFVGAAYWSSVRASAKASKAL